MKRCRREEHGVSKVHNSIEEEQFRAGRRGYHTHLS